MSVIQRRSDAPPTELTVVAVVLADVGHNLAAALEAVVGQGYDLAATYVVGGPPEAQGIALERDASWVATLRDVLSRSESTHVWLLHEDAIPQPGALAALISELSRNDAAAAGSKILRPGPAHQLESIGVATDVFAYPYTGLEVDEVDQGQHDIVRDVSFVSGVSMVTRRDLLAGLGGPDPRMVPLAAALDLCWRVRLAGGRVIVVPSSEVAHTGECRTRVPAWRQRAGEIRAMLKNYSWLTLPWAVPAGFLVGLFTALARTFVDRRTGLWDFARAWVWNLVRFPSLVRSRGRVRKARVVGDEEHFRYQVRGSVEVRETIGVISDAIRRRAEDRAADTSPGLAPSGMATAPPYVGALVIGLLYVVASTWSILVDGVPVTGFALPLSDSVSATFDSWSGGWNPGGLGSGHPLHPSVGATGLVNAALLSNSDLAATVLSLGAVTMALLGTTRVLRRLGAAPFARYVSGAVVAAGPATIGLASVGYWPGLLAVGAAPWALASLLAPWPEGWRGRVGWTATATLLVGVLALLAPFAVVVPVLSIAGWVLFGPGRWRLAVRALPPTFLALVLLNPWLTAVSGPEVLAEGTLAFWNPSLVLMGALAMCVLMPVLIGDGWSAGVAGTGGVLVGLGAVAARATEVGVGREVAVAGLVAAALGSGLAVAAAFETPRRLETARLFRKLVAWTGAAAGLLLLASALAVVPDGRAGLPPDQFGRQLEFTVNRAEPHGPDRILLVGPDGTLPGEYRTGPGFTYRVVSAPAPPLNEAWLSDPLAGDVALEQTMVRLTTGDELRPGEALRPFGIRWVVLTGPTPFDAALQSQLDLRPLPLVDYRVFENENPSPRAVSADGRAWERMGVGYTGDARPTGRLYVAENSDPRWGPDWAASGWANEVATRTGSARFEGIASLRTVALLTILYAVLLLGVALWGRRAK